MMQYITNEFEGLVVIKLKVFADQRGFFYESWKELDYQEVGINEKFLQDNVSSSQKNVLRGLHYRKNQGQLVTVTVGKVFDVVVDIRPQSRTYKKYFTMELAADNPQQIYMPPGFAHGFYVLSEVAVVNYKCTQYYDASQECGIIWNDPAIGIDWPSGEKNISAKDQEFCSLELTDV